MTRIDLAIEGMTCASCVARVEKRLGRIEGVTATVNLATERASVVAPDGLDTAELVTEIERAGYSARVLDDARADSAGSGAGRLLPRLIAGVALSVPIVLLAMLPALRFPGWGAVSLLLGAPVVLWAGWPFHRSAAVNLRHGSATMDTLVSLGTLAALLWSTAVIVTGGGHVYVEVAAVVTVFLLLGRYVEERTRRRAGAALRELAASGGREVWVVADDGTEQRVPVDALERGMRFSVRPGERIAADGVVVDGAAAVDVSAMTGESVPVEVAAGDEVTAGTIAAGGRLVVRAVRVGPDTRLARLAAMVEAAQLGKTRAQRLADRVSGVFVPIVIGLAVLTFVAWAVISGDPAVALSPAVAVLIVACPCALGLATPVALLVGTTRAAQRGILISGQEALERAGRIDTVVFDKTGTLTTGTMTVIETVPVAGWQAGEVLRLAAAAECGSEHPIGRAIAAADPSAPKAERFRAVAGLGVTASVDGREIAVARPEGELPPGLRGAVDRIRAEGRTAVAVTVDGAPAGVLGIGDPLRADAEDAVRLVRQAGAEPLVLSGDHPATVAAVLAPLGIADARGGVSPEGKAEAVALLRGDGRRVAVVGDGVNDAAALAGADLGIAMGTGTDVAMAAADVTLLRPEPALVGRALALSRRMLSVIRGNLFWAFAYNVAAIPVAALGLLDPMIAGAAMAFSSIFVVLNSLRLRRL